MIEHNFTDNYFNKKEVKRFTVNESGSVTTGHAAVVINKVRYTLTTQVVLDVAHGYLRMSVNNAKSASLLVFHVDAADIHNVLKQRMLIDKQHLFARVNINDDEFASIVANDKLSNFAIRLGSAIADWYGV